jgi:uroporphyrinogen-III synthase
LPDRVLVTRPEPGASETAARLTALGFIPVLAPVMTIAPRLLEGASLAQAVLVTSGNAIAALPDSLHARPLLAVGDATAARARDAGFSVVHSAGRDAAALAELAASLLAPAAGPLLLASGEGQGMALATGLRARGFTVRRRVAYAARPATSLPDEARAALAGGAIRAALFFSPLSARAFVTMLQRDMPAGVVRCIEALAISRATEVALMGLPWRRVRVASRPNQDELLTLLP